MSEVWTSTLVFLLLSAVVAASLLWVSRALRVRAKHSSELKGATYECGEEPDGPAWVRFHPRYYVVALVFVLFDVEAVFLFPWALNIGRLGLFAIVEMALFIAILLFGWAYAIRKGALEWQ
ncbi:MAG: NADH-quinone oxidoreductase subunit A [Deltaproteobacteria bacterium]|nr:NADH-quinone oxidoreductase subunit A [Deltaproteobacteria bacterium]